MPRFVDAITGNPDVKFFRVLDSDADHPGGWELEPLPNDLLSDTDSDGLHVMKALNVLPDGTIRECYMDMNLPERISDHAFFVERDSFRFGHHHEFPNEVIPAVALDCFGLYELFYSRTRPEVGLDILKRGLTIAKRKHYIAEDLGYILTDERRFREAVEMFKIAVEEGPSSYFIYGELAGAYAKLGDAENEKQYMEKFKRAEALQVAKHVQGRRLETQTPARMGSSPGFLRRFLSLFRKSRADEPAWPVIDTHKGKLLAILLKEYGKPSKDLAGYYKHGSTEPAQELPKGMPSAPHRTLVFRRAGGVLYVWLHPASDSWVCFQSFWLPDGW
jgi:tetratricopeptide (TPR) repeat protein